MKSANRIQLTRAVSNFLEMPMGSLDGLPLRVLNSLESAGILFVGDLLEACSRTAAECEKHCICRQTCDRPKHWQPKARLPEVPNLAAKTMQGVLQLIQNRLQELGAYDHV